MKRKESEIILYSEKSEIIRASVYRTVIDQSTAAGKRERLGLAEVITDSGEHINVTINGV